MISYDILTSHWDISLLPTIAQCFRLNLTVYANNNVSFFGQQFAHKTTLAIVENCFYTAEVVPNDPLSISTIQSPSTSEGTKF